MAVKILIAKIPPRS